MAVLPRSPPGGIRRPGGALSFKDTWWLARGYIVGLIVAVVLLTNVALTTARIDFPPPLFVASLFVGVVLALLLGKTTVQLGTDGVYVTTLGAKRFTRYADIRSVIAQGQQVSLVLKDNSWVPVLKGFSFMYGASRKSPAVDDLAGRIEQNRHVSDVPIAPSPPALARGERSEREWIAAAAALGRGDAAYREMGIEPAALRRIVSDPVQPRDVRLGAAVALRASGDDAAKAHIRVAAADSAEPHLRVALEAIADDEATDGLEERVAKMRILST